MSESTTTTAFDKFGPDNAPSVVLIHGLGLNRACWQWMVPSLSARYRVLTYDLFGHGQSSDPTAKPSLQLFSQQLEELLNASGIDKAVLVGFSLGGMIARRFVQDTPSRARALVILHSAHTRSDTAQKAIRQRVEQAKREGAGATVEDALERWFTKGFRASNPETTDLVRSWVLSNRKSIYHQNYSVLAEGVPEIVAPRPPIACPTLVMTSDQDFGNNPEQAKAIAAEIEGAETVVLNGLRHMALAEDPQSVNEPILRFLETLDKETTT